MENKQTTKELGELIMAGVRKAVSKVIEEAKLRDEEIVISRDGKVVHVRARDLK